MQMSYKWISFFKQWGEGEKMGPACKGSLVRKTDMKWSFPECDEYLNRGSAGCGHIRLKCDPTLLRWLQPLWERCLSWNLRMSMSEEQQRKRSRGFYFLVIVILSPRPHAFLAVQLWHCSLLKMESMFLPFESGRLVTIIQVTLCDFWY